MRCRMMGTWEEGQQEKRKGRQMREEDGWEKRIETLWGVKRILK